jgi:hypothetical protein
MVLFSIAGATFGMSEEVIPFVLLFIPLARNLGYDSITGVAMCYMAAHIGFAGLVSAMPATLRVAATLFSSGVTIFFFVLMAWIGTQLLPIIAGITLVSLPEVSTGGIRHLPRGVDSWGLSGTLSRGGIGRDHRVLGASVRVLGFVPTHGAPPPPCSSSTKRGSSAPPVSQHYYNAPK